MCTETYTYFGVGFEESGRRVEKESSGRVKAELVNAGVPYPFIRPCQQEWCGGRVGWRSGCYDDRLWELERVYPLMVGGGEGGELSFQVCPSQIKAHKYAMSMCRNGSSQKEPEFPWNYGGRLRGKVGRSKLQTASSNTKGGRVVTCTTYSYSYSQLKTHIACTYML